MDQQNNQQRPIKKEEGCNVRFKRDKQGRIIGFNATGKCTKEHLKLANGSVEDYSGGED